MHIKHQAAAGGRMRAVMLHTIAYTSFATREYSLNELEVWLKDFRAKNQRLGITGLLAYECKIFCQFLEGEEATVRELIQEIWADKRHFFPAIRLDLPIQNRAFPDWDMGLQGLSSVENCSVSELPKRYRDVIRFVFARKAIRAGRPE